MTEPSSTEEKKTVLANIGDLFETAKKTTVDAAKKVFSKSPETQKNESSQTGGRKKSRRSRRKSRLSRRRKGGDITEEDPSTLQNEDTSTLAAIPPSQSSPSTPQDVEMEDVEHTERKVGTKRPAEPSDENEGPTPPPGFSDEQTGGRRKHRKTHRKSNKRISRRKQSKKRHSKKRHSKRRH